MLVPLPQIMKTDPQMPEGLVLVDTPMFSELHSLSTDNVNFFSVHSLSLSLAAFVSLFISQWFSHFPHLLTIIPFDPFCILTSHICHVMAEAALGTL